MTVCSSSSSATSFASSARRFVNVARAETDHAVARLEHAADLERDLFPIRLEARGIVSFAHHFIDDRLPAHVRESAASLAG